MQADITRYQTGGYTFTWVMDLRTVLVTHDGVSVGLFDIRDRDRVGADLSFAELCEEWMEEDERFYSEN